MEAILGVLGAMAVLAGGVFAFAPTGIGNMTLGVALICAGLGFLATAKIITVLMEIRDRLPEPKTPPKP
ncbi:hypothetical protein [Pseudooceanicola atlanticus]|uniref:Uncharacterized protein n=1 Tax=Pseudooceanicola atlanticus TaxID=1461694 RepID=A0A0A0EN71_9RHOB|nr:hypothetical protein [Pseudooceanicola atlanticus]KGM50662.1 hypothetical protein ATO9_04110 [Pseudooceanicola atlanticus]